LPRRWPKNALHYVVTRKTEWKTLPTPRRKMAQEFATLPEDDLKVSDFDVLLR
jgi:hypothetical protein